MSKLVSLKEQLARARLDEFVCSSIKVCSFRTVRIRPGSLPQIKNVRVKSHLHRCRRLIKRFERSLVAVAGKFVLTF